ncbi:MAG: protease inhibitor I42 family protein [Nitrospira sp.]|nr:protease inhibitor I42 family protein [Nitrospira sp.]
MAASDGPAGETKHVAVQIGQPFPITLWEDRTRGEQWVPTYDTAAVALVSDDYHRVAGNNAVDNGTRVFAFRALGPGAHKILFEKRMGWKFTAEDRRVFLVTATDGSTRGS